MKRPFVILFLLAGSLLLATVAFAQPKALGKPVDYTAEGVVLKGYLAYDEGVKEKRPVEGLFPTRSGSPRPGPPGVRAAARPAGARA